MRAEILALALVLLALTLLASLQVYTRFPQLVAPSPRNPGPGGLTEFVKLLTSRGVQVFEPTSLVNALSILRNFNASKVALIITGLSDEDKPYLRDLVRWVKLGGKLIVMDELDDIDELLKILRFDMTEPYVSVAKAKCIDGNVITVDVYAFVIGGNALCSIGNAPIASEKRLGKGDVIVIGDSSLVINYIAKYPRTYANNTRFILSILGYRDAVAIYYPRSREFVALKIGRALEVLSTLILFIAKISISTPLSASLLTFFVASVAALAATRVSKGRLMRRKIEDLDKAIYEARRNLNTLIEALSRKGREYGRG